MKKITFLVLLALCGSIHAQNSVPNGNFESWTEHSFSLPTNYPYSSNSEHPTASVYPITRVNGVSGYAVQLETTAQYGFAYCLNDIGNEGPPNHGGVPYSQMPTGIQCSYKYNSLYDHGVLLVGFSKNGVNINTYMFNLDGVHTDWTTFQADFSPALTETPDSVVVGFVSSNFEGTYYPGSILTLDNLSFTGVNSQPALLNGDFEQWSDVSLNTPDTWDNDFKEERVHRTTDAYEGNYAVKLETVRGEKGEDEVKNGQIMTGYYEQGCDGNCYPLGGYPYNNMADDVLEFYYKYAPTGNHPASVDFWFRKNNGNGNIQSGGTGHKTLAAASQWTYAEAPVYISQLGFTPDTVVVQFSSTSGDVKTLADVGSILLIDKVVFRSQKGLGVNNISADNFMVYPNPASDKVTLNVEGNATVKLYKSTGEMVKILQPGSAKQIDVSRFSSGVYILEANTTQGSVRQKLIIQH